MSNFSTEIWDPGLLSQSCLQQQKSGANSQSNTGKTSQNDLRKSTSSTNSNTTKEVSGNTSPSLQPTSKRGIIYRIFHVGDHSDDEHHSLWGKSRRTYHSGSEAESDDDYHSDDSHGSLGRNKRGSSSTSSQPSQPPTRKNSLSEAMEFIRKSSNSFRGRSSSVKNKGVFSNVAEDSSDYESEMEDEVHRKPKGNLFKDLLSGNRSRKTSQSVHSPPTSPKSQPDSHVIHASPFSLGPPAIQDSKSEQPHHHNIFSDLLGHKPRRASQSQQHPPLPPTASPPKVKSHHEMDRYDMSSMSSTLNRSNSETSLNEKYGKLEDVLGKGAFATVKLCCPLNSNKKFAVKEFRKKRKDESSKEYVKKLIAEFCISSSLDHENVVKTVDLIQDNVRLNIVFISK